MYQHDDSAFESDGAKEGAEVFYIRLDWISSRCAFCEQYECIDLVGALICVVDYIQSQLLEYVVNHFFILAVVVEPGRVNDS